MPDSVIKSITRTEFVWEYKDEEGKPVELRIKRMRPGDHNCDRLPYVGIQDFLWEVNIRTAQYVSMFPDKLEDLQLQAAKDLRFVRQPDGTYIMPDGRRVCLRSGISKNALRQDSTVMMLAIQDNLIRLTPNCAKLECGWVLAQ
jgi:hypothetical protein